MATFTVRDVVDRYGVHEQTVLLWIRNGELDAVNVGREPGKQKPRWRITQEALAAFEARRSTNGQTDVKPQRRRRRKSKPVEDFVG